MLSNLFQKRPYHIHEDGLWKIVFYPAMQWDEVVGEMEAEIKFVREHGIASGMADHYKRTIVSRLWERRINPVGLRKLLETYLKEYDSLIAFRGEDHRKVDDVFAYGDAGAFCIYFTPVAGPVTSIGFSSVYSERVVDANLLACLVKIGDLLNLALVDWDEPKIINLKVRHEVLDYLKSFATKLPPRPAKFGSAMAGTFMEKLKLI